MFFDIETIPEPNHRARFSEIARSKLPSVCDERSLLRPKDVIYQFETVGEVKTYLSKIDGVAPVPWLDTLKHTEVLSKNRTSLISEIDKRIDKSKASMGDDKKESKDMATSPAFLKIIAIGYAIEDDPVTTLVVGEDGTEEDILRHWWEKTKECLQFAGWYSNDFDWPAIKLRSKKLRIPVLDTINDNRWSGNLIDGYREIFGYKQGGATGKLNEVAYILGYRDDIPEVDGSQVERLYSEDTAKLRMYLSGDVDDTRSVCMGFGLTDYRRDL